MPSSSNACPTFEVKAAHDGTTWAMGSHGPMGAGRRPLALPSSVNTGRGHWIRRHNTHRGSWRKEKVESAPGKGAPLDDTQCIPANGIFFRDTAAQHAATDTIRSTIPGTTFTRYPAGCSRDVPFRFLALVVPSGLLTSRISSDVSAHSLFMSRLTVARTGLFALTTEHGHHS